MDVASELERVLSAPPGEPPHRPLPDLVERGQRALRRRRLAVAGAVVGVVAVTVVTLGVGVGVVTRADDTGRTVATDATDGTDGTGATDAPTVSDPPVGGPPVAYVEGELVVADGVEVLERVDDPLGYADPGDSAALRLLVDGEETWALARWVAGGDAAGVATEEVVTPDEVEQKTFAGWVQVRRYIHGGASELVLLLEETPQPTLVSREGAAILDQRPNVDLGETFAPPGWTTAAAMVEKADGERWFVLVRSSAPGKTQYISWPARRADGAASLVAFLDFAKPRYESGQGLL